MEDDSRFQSHHKTVNGLFIHYKCLGEGAPLILLHGVGSDWHEWEEDIPLFARHFRVVVPDLPGFGLSDPLPETTTPFRYAAFLNEFMDALDLKDACVIGHSLGGAVALALASDYPQRVRKLVVIDSAGLGHLSWRGTALRSFHSLMHAITDRTHSSPPFGKAEDWVLVDHLGAIKSPVLLVWGGGDPYFPLSQARQAQKLIPDCRLEVFNCSCHSPQREFTEEFHQVVHQFLTE